MTFTSFFLDILTRCAELMNIKPNTDNRGTIIMAFIAIALTIVCIAATHRRTDILKSGYNYCKLAVNVLIIFCSFLKVENSTYASMIIDICIVATALMALICFLELFGIVMGVLDLCEVPDKIKTSAPTVIDFMIAAFVSGFTFHCGLQQVINLLNMVN